MHGHSTEIRLCIAPACEGWKHIGESKRPRPTCYLCDGEAEADGGVCERHDGGEDGEPPELVEVGELREQGLDAREDGHVHRGVGPARRVVAVAVEAVGPVDRPATNFIQTICPSSIYHACEKDFFLFSFSKIEGRDRFLFSRHANTGHSFSGRWPPPSFFLLWKKEEKQQSS
jgi:hypothetical protein